MMFKGIDYLKSGNKRQKLAYSELKNLNVFKILKEFNPFLVGTIPLGIDIEGSDLDIICQSSDFHKFIKVVKKNYGSCNGFLMTQKVLRERDTCVVNFEGEFFPIEIFLQNHPVKEQMAYLHMMKEYEILKEKNADFKRKVIDLKRNGLSTEEAFGKLMGLDGDVYKKLLSVNV